MLSFHVPALDPESDNRSSSDSPINIGESVKIICAGISKFLGIGAARHHDVDDVKDDANDQKILLFFFISSSYDDYESCHSVDTKHQKD